MKRINILLIFLGICLASQAQTATSDTTKTTPAPSTTQIPSDVSAYARQQAETLRLQQQLQLLNDSVAAQQARIETNNTLLQRQSQERRAQVNDSIRQANAAQKRIDRQNAIDERKAEKAAEKAEKEAAKEAKKQADEKTTEPEKPLAESAPTAQPESAPVIAQQAEAAPQPAPAQPAPEATTPKTEPTEAVSSSALPYSVTGKNVIIGNNNTIYIVNDQTVLPQQYQQPYPVAPTKQRKVKPDYNERFFNNVSLAIRANTYGLGLDFAATLSKHFQMRLGADVMIYNHQFTTTTNDAAIKNVVQGSYNPDFRFNADVKFINGHLLFDYHPWKNGVFFITAGAFIGQNAINVDGQLIDPASGAAAQLQTGKSWPNATFANHPLTINNGNITADVLMNDWVKPYVGLGLGRSVPRKRVGFLFEVGAIYQGSFRVQQNGNTIVSNSTSSDSFVKSDNYQRFLSIYPMVNMQLSIRLNK